MRLCLLVRLSDGFEVIKGVNKGYDLCIIYSVLAFEHVFSIFLIYIHALFKTSGGVFDEVVCNV